MFKNTKIFGLPIPIFGTFEEINLRFYVKRIVNGVERRGVVFINETVPNKLVAWVANKLYKEHYTAATTQHNWKKNEQEQEISYGLKVNNKWNNFTLIAHNQKDEMRHGSPEKFIFEHYFGYTKVNQHKTLEYKINHPSWEINKIISFEVNFDFENFYGEAFGFLSQAKPHSVMLTAGSAVSVDWKRIAI